MLLPLVPFGRAADLAVEKLWYHAIARSVDLGQFTLGLRASASFQACLSERHREATRHAEGDPDAAEYLVLAEEVDGGSLRLRSFARPGASSSLDLATLVSGASLNTCRCCLEVGSRQALGLLVAELGRSAGVWIDRVSELGQTAKAGE